MIIKLKELIRILSGLNIEYRIGNKIVVLTCSKMPDQKTKDLIASYFPEKYKLKFKEDYKICTMISIKDIITPALNGDYSHSVIGKELKLYLDGTVNPGNITWSDIKRVIDKDGFFDSWVVEINGKKFHPDLLADETIYNNSKREKVISRDEITNLSIILNTTTNVEEFLKRI